MFDKLIVSEPDRGEAHHRRNYFLVSTVVVGLLFVTGVVISIYASDFSLGTSSFELTELIAPLDMAAPEPVIRPQALPNSPAHSPSTFAIRRENVLDISEEPKVPDSISTTPSSSVPRPLGLKFGIGKVNADPAPGDQGSRGDGGRGEAAAPHGIGAPIPRNNVEDEPTPPPAKPQVPKAPVTRGVVNGMARSLPKPEYSAAARLVRAEGKVNIQVTIDENGKVISARALDGHPLLRPAAENAARRANFSPTLLSGSPVKVTGVIVYNFIL